MSKEICDICGNEFVWKKGMAYCSYDCAQKARQKLEQQAEKYQEKIKKETQCPACGFIGVDIERRCNDDHGLYWETFYKCKKCGRKTKDKQWYVYKKPTNGDVIRQMSNKELATCIEELAFRFCSRREFVAWLNAPAESEGEK